jgi:hypothetical protein
VTRRSTIIAQGSYEYKFEVPFFPLHVVKFNPNFGLRESSVKGESMAAGKIMIIWRRMKLDYLCTVYTSMELESGN